MKKELKEKRKKFIDKIKYILVFMLILISDDTLLFGTNSNAFFINLKYIYIISITIVISVLLFIKTKKVNRKYFVVYALLFMMIFLSMIFNDDYRFGYIYKFFLILYSISITSLIELRDFSKYFTKIMFFLSCVSIIGYFLSVLDKSIVSFLPNIINTAETSFNNYLIFVSPNYFYSGFVRNYGIFREPGVFQMFVIISMLLEIKVLKTKSLFKYLVYIVTIITTMSTTGYIALFLTIILLLIDDNCLITKKKGLLIINILIGLVVLINFTSIFSLSQEDQFNSVFGKLNNKVNNGIRATTVARFGSITENIKMFFESPIYGVGLTNLSEKFPIYTLERYGRLSVHNTNTFLIQFASHGFLYGVIWLHSYYKFGKQISKKNSLLIFIILLILYLGEDLTYSGFSHLFMAYGILFYNKEEIEEGYL